MKAPRGSRGVVLLFPNLGARWGWMVNVITRLLYPPSLGRALVLTGGGWMGPSASLDGFWQRQNLLPPLEIKPWTIQLIVSCCRKL